MAIPAAGHILCWRWVEFAGVRKQPHRRVTRQAQEVSGQEEVLITLVAFLWLFSAVYF